MIFSLRRLFASIFVPLLVSVTWVTAVAAQSTVTFEGLSFPEGQDFYNGADGAGHFFSDGARFENAFTDFGTFTAWEGFAYSRVTDNTTPGFQNQYSAFPGGGADESVGYGVAFSGADAGGSVAPTLRLPGFAQPLSIKVTNTTFAALSMRDGDAFADPFGGPNGEEPDFFLLSVQAIDANGQTVAQLDPFPLADYRFEESDDDYIVDQWVELDLRSLRGPDVVGLELRLETSDIGSFGPNTPMYVAIDDLTYDVVRSGDFNGDGRVDAADYTVWRDTLGQSVALEGAGADADFSGVVDVADYAIWKQRFGTTYPMPSLAAFTVPEPKTRLLIGLAMFAVLFSRWRFRFLHLDGKAGVHMCRFSYGGVVVGCLFAGTAWAGPFPSFSDVTSQVQPSDIVAWATSVDDYSPSPGVDDDFDNIASALGPADSSIVSLGDLDATQIGAGVAPGTITVQFSATIFDGPGADFAVFENAGTFFTDPYVFAELAYVEVSSNGTDFVRFASTSLNIEPDANGELDPDELAVPFGRSFAGADTTNIDNLAGIHPAGIGTPFDLSELTSDADVLSGLVDLNSIQYVRLVDIPGNGAFLDAAGRPILDTWLSASSGGFDLDAVGAIHVVPEPSTLVLALLASIALTAGCRLRS